MRQSSPPNLTKLSASMLSRERSKKVRIINEDGNLIEIEPKVESLDADYSSSDIEFEEVTIAGTSNSFPQPIKNRDSSNISISHDNNSISSRKSKVYMCKPCDVNFSDFNSLEKHFDSVHQNKVKGLELKQGRTKSIIEKLQERANGYSKTENGKFACNYCDYQSILRDCVAAHVTRLHKNHDQSISVRTPSITLAIEPVVKEESDIKQTETVISKNEEEVVEEVPIGSVIDDVTKNLVEGDAEMVREADELLADDYLNGDLIGEDDDDYGMEQSEEADDYVVHPDEMGDYEMHADEMDYGDQAGEYEEEVHETTEYVDHVEDSVIYEDQVEYVEGYEAEHDEAKNSNRQVETHLVEHDNEYMTDKESQNVQLVTYTCPYCDYTTTDKTVVHEHITTEHNDVWNSKVCSEIEDTKQRDQKKLGKKGKKTGYDCLYCEFIARTRTILYEHTRANHSCNVKPAKFRKQPPDELKCDQCDFITIDRRKMMMHIERKHTTEYRFTCEFCGKKFKVKCDLTSHIRFQHFTVPLVCDVCGKVCNNSNSLHVHQKREHYKPEFECHICRRRMVSQENLDEHILRQHEQRTTFMCEQCGKVFDQASKLRQHTMTHTGERPHTCHLCGKAFARRAVFRQHLLIHTGEKPYVCDICGKSFTQKPGLICHRKMHPGEKPPLPVVYIDHILKKVQKKNDC